MPLHYWAKFRRRGEHQVRLDTRIYLISGDSHGDGGRCIGCVVGKNPGSAMPGHARRGHVAMELRGDRFLPNVRAIVTKAYARAGVTPEPDAYVQVLNLFYLCDRNLSQALKKLCASNSLPHCSTELELFPWAWFVWGGNDARLNAMKERFQGLRAKHCFFVDGKRNQIVDRAPGAEEMARHTQGLPHEPAVAHLSSLIARMCKAR